MGTREGELDLISSVRQHGSLTIRTEDQDHSRAIRAEGELDIASAPALERSLLHAFESGASSIVLDLSEVRFIDAAGLRTVLWAQQHSRDAADRVQIVAGSAAIRRMLPS
jgi:anti-sigma B factor antagonist